MKKSQITVFIILGILLVGIISLFFYMNIYKSEKQLERTITNMNVPVDYRPIWEHVARCLDQSYLKVAGDVGYTGGFFYGTDNGYTLDGVTIPFYYSHRDEHVPTIPFLFSNLKTGVTVNFDSCIDLSSFKGYSIETKGTPEVGIYESNNKTHLTLNYPMVIKNGEKEYPLKDFELTYDSRFNMLMHIADIIVYEHLGEDPFSIFYTRLVGLEKVYGVNITTYYFDPGVVVYEIYDEKNLPERQEPYIFRFASQVLPTDFPPFLKERELHLYEDVLYDGFLSVQDWRGEGLEYWTDDFLPINPHNGYIYYTPTGDDVGIHDVSIVLDDGYQNITETLTVIVHETLDAPLLYL
jgi:hypothetical protein